MGFARTVSEGVFFEMVKAVRVASPAETIDGRKKR